METLNEQLEKLKAAVDSFEVSEKKARELLPKIPQANLFVGIRGVKTDISQFELLEGLCWFRPVINPPGLVHVSGAADLQKTDWIGVSRYSSGIVAELALGNERLRDHDFLLGMAWVVIALLKLRGHNRLTCPVAARPGR